MKIKTDFKGHVTPDSLMGWILGYSADPCGNVPVIDEDEEDDVTPIT